MTPAESVSRRVPAQPPLSGPEVTIHRRLEWPDTDASGHQHHSVVLRWVESAEADLLDRLGYPTLFGRTPRVRYEVEYRARLWFRDEITIRLGITRVGRSSMTYGFEVDSANGRAADGQLTVVHTAGSTGRSQPWPDAIRAALTGS